VQFFEYFSSFLVFFDVFDCILCIVIFSVHVCYLYSMCGVYLIACHTVALFQIGLVETLISVDFDESLMEQTVEIAEYLNAVESVLTYYNEYGQVKHVYVCQVLLPVLKSLIEMQCRWNHYIAASLMSFLFLLVCLWGRLRGQAVIYTVMIYSGEITFITLTLKHNKQI